MGVELPAFQPSALEEIPKIAERVRSTFFTHKTKPVEFRIQQLRKLYWGCVSVSKLVAGRGQRLLTWFC